MVDIDTILGEISDPEDIHGEVEDIQDILNSSEDENMPMPNLSNGISEKSVDPLILIQKEAIEQSKKTDKVLKQTLHIKRAISSTSLPVIQIEDIATISKRISPPIGMSSGFPRSIAVSEDYVIVGNEVGIITVFKHSGEEVKQLSVTSARSFGAVTCMDVSQDQTQLITGYEKGQVCLWDLVKKKKIKASNAIHSTTVLSIKFWKPGFALSSDLQHQVASISFTKSFMSTQMLHSKMFKGEAGVVISIEPLFPNPDFPHVSDQISLVALASEEKVAIVEVEPDIQFRFEVPRPQEINIGILPCISWGRALTPGHEEAKNPVLAVGWGLKIYLFKIMTLMESGCIQAGYLTVETEIRSIKWLNESMLFMLDRSNEVSIWNSTAFNTDRAPEKTTHVLLESLFLNSEDLAFQNYYVDILGNECATLHNSIQMSDRWLMILGNRRLSRGRVLTWEECLDTLVKKGEWVEALSLGLDIYEGRGKRLCGIPKSIESIRQRLEYLVEEYVRAGMTWEYKIPHSIEFCIGINATELLFNHLFDFFVDTGNDQANLKIFLDTIEPFILNGEITSIAPQVLGKMLGYYMSFEQQDIIERIILHLDPK